MNPILTDKLKKLKHSTKIPAVILITGLQSDQSLETLEWAAGELEGQAVSEAKGNKLTLQAEPGVSIKVDQVRDMLKKMSLRNWAEGSSRYILVPHAERLTVQSSNALLKSLEEAPEGTHFLLAAPSKKTLLKTIISRSFVIYAADKLDTATESTVFDEAFFEKNTSALSSMSRSDLSRDWDRFNLRLKDHFCDKVYSGEIDSSEWYRLFDFMTEIDQKISTHSDPKWLASAIERFGFNG